MTKSIVKNVSFSELLDYVTAAQARKSFLTMSENLKQVAKEFPDSNYIQINTRRTSDTMNATCHLIDWICSDVVKMSFSGIQSLPFELEVTQLVPKCILDEEQIVFQSYIPNYRMLTILSESEEHYLMVTYHISGKVDDYIYSTLASKDLRYFNSKRTYIPTVEEFKTQLQLITKEWESITYAPEEVPDMDVVLANNIHGHFVLGDKNYESS